MIRCVWTPPEYDDLEPPDSPVQAWFSFDNERRFVGWTIDTACGLDREFFDALVARFDNEYGAERSPSGIKMTMDYLWRQHSGTTLVP